MKLLLLTSENGMLSNKKLENTSYLKERHKQKVKNVYCNNVKVQDVDLLNEILPIYTKDQMLRIEWLKTKDTLVLRKVEELDSISFILVEKLIKEGRYPVKNQLNLDGYLGVIFLHATSQQFANDAIGFEEFRKLVYNEVMMNRFSPNSYALWVDRYQVFHKKEAQIYGVFRSFDTPIDELPEIISIEEVERSRSKLGLRTIEQGVEYRKLNQ